MNTGRNRLQMLGRLCIVLGCALIGPLTAHLTSRAFWALSSDPVAMIDPHTGYTHHIEKTLLNYDQFKSISEMVTSSLLIFVCMLAVVLAVMKFAELINDAVNYIKHG